MLKNKPSKFKWSDVTWEGNDSPEFQAKVMHSSNCPWKSGFIRLLKTTDMPHKRYAVFSSFGPNSHHSWGGGLEAQDGETIASLQQRAVDQVFTQNRWPKPF